MDGIIETTSGLRTTISKRATEAAVRSFISKATAPFDEFLTDSHIVIRKGMTREEVLALEREEIERNQEKFDREEVIGWMKHLTNSDSTAADLKEDEAHRKQFGQAIAIFDSMVKIVKGGKRIEFKPGSSSPRMNEEGRVDLIDPELIAPEKLNKNFFSKLDGDNRENWNDLISSFKIGAYPSSYQINFDEIAATILLASLKDNSEGSLTAENLQRYISRKEQVALLGYNYIQRANNIDRESIEKMVEELIKKEEERNKINKKEDEEIKVEKSPEVWSWNFIRQELINACSLYPVHNIHSTEKRVQDAAIVAKGFIEFLNNRQDRPRSFKRIVKSLKDILGLKERGVRIEYKSGGSEYKPLFTEEFISTYKYLTFLSEGKGNEKEVSLDKKFKFERLDNGIFQILFFHGINGENVIYVSRHMYHNATQPGGEITPRNRMLEPVFIGRYSKNGKLINARFTTYNYVKHEDDFRAFRGSRR